MFMHQLVTNRSDIAQLFKQRRWNVTLSVRQLFVHATPFGFEVRFQNMLGLFGVVNNLFDDAHGLFPYITSALLRWIVVVALYLSVSVVCWLNRVHCSVQRLFDDGVGEVQLGVAGVLQAFFQLVAEGHKFIDFGDYAALLGEGREWDD